MSFPLRMVHEHHGAMHVYDEGQKQAHEKLGWKAEGQENQVGHAPAAPPPDTPAPAAATAVQPQKRPGRPRKAA